jgi:succinoglycan biosynthesis protein ExoO
MPQVSVITPAFEAESFIDRTVTSVLNQSLRDFEHVICADDGRDYEKILADKGIRDPRLRFVSTGSVGTGPGHARNTAVKAAGSPVIASLDNDDLLRFDALETLVPQVMRHGAAYSDIDFRYFDSDAPLPNYNRRMPEGLLNIEQVLTGTVHTYVWILFNREKMPDACWDEKVPHFNDVLMYGWCCDRLGRMYYTPERLYIYHRRKGSMCSKPGLEENLIIDCNFMLSELEQGRLLSHSTPGSGEIMKKYIGRWLEVEHLCIDAMRAGRYTDYIDFLRDHRELLYNLT